MKPFISIFILLVSIQSYAQIPSFTVQYFEAKPWQEAEISQVFDDFYTELEFNSGGIYLERLRAGNTEGSHRIVYFGDAENWGLKEGQKNRSERTAFWRNLSDNVASWGATYTGRILDYHGDGAPDDYGYIQIYEVKVADPVSFMKAHKKIVSETSQMMDGRPVAFGTYDIGSPNGATHWVAVGYKGVGDNLKMKSQTEKLVKEWTTYFKTRGYVEDTGNFDLRILKSYGSFN